MEIILSRPTLAERQETRIRDYKLIAEFLSAQDETFVVQKMHPYDLFALTLDGKEHTMVFFEDDFAVFFLLDGVATFLTVHTPAKTKQIR